MNTPTIAARMAARPHPAPLERRRMISARDPFLAAAEAALIPVWCGK